MIGDPIPPCRHGDGHQAVARFQTPEGEQDLCAQHIEEGIPTGEDIRLLRVYQSEIAKELKLIYK